MTAIEPMSNHLLVAKLRGPEQIGSIHVPEAHVEDASFGEVLACGHQVHRISVGDHVYFQKYAGFAIKQGEEEFVLLPQEDVLAVDRDPR